MNFHPEHFSEKAKIYEPIKRDNSQFLDALVHTENLTQAEEETKLQMFNENVNKTEAELETSNLSKEKIKYIRNEGIESKIKLISSVLLPAYMLQSCSDHRISHETDLLPPAGAGNQNCKHFLSAPCDQNCIEVQGRHWYLLPWLVVETIELVGGFIQFAVTFARSENW